MASLYIIVAVYALLHFPVQSSTDHPFYVVLDKQEYAMNCESGECHWVKDAQECLYVARREASKVLKEMPLQKRKELDKIVVTCEVREF